MASWYKHMTKGMTLIELTLAMAVLMVALGAIMISTSGRNNDYRTVYNAARVLQADMRYIQRRAIMEGREMRMYFDLRANRYVIYAPPDVSNVYRTVYLPDGVVFLPATTFHGRGMGYRPRGTPTQAGTITLQKGRYRRRVTVIPAGGRAEVQPADIVGG
ncbi:MAG: GspH/FimT family protein [Defluviitaleaceae bacterium]|nr:GspH/FimT family protein [Defluviitaleaceae bacterium]